jgi:hypothetical protein
MQYCIEIGNTNFQKTKTEKRKDNNTHLSSLSLSKNSKTEKHLLSKN